MLEADFAPLNYSYFIEVNFIDMECEFKQSSLVSRVHDSCVMDHGFKSLKI